MSDSVSVIVRGKRRLFDGFFKLDEMTVSHRRFDGTMSAEQKIIIFERGDAVAALIFNRDRNEVVLEDGGLGLPLKIVQHRLGHSSIQMTSDVYGHLFPSEAESRGSRSGPCWGELVVAGYLHRRGVMPG